MNARKLDWFIMPALLLGGLAAYVDTLAPTVLDGDPALYQYAPYILGVTYPSGFRFTCCWASSAHPLSLRRGRLAHESPLGGVCGADLARHLQRRPPHLGQSIRRLTDRPGLRNPTHLLALGTEAKTYTMNILVFSLVLWLAVTPERGGGVGGSGGKGEREIPPIPIPNFRLPPSTAVSWILRHRYHWAALLMGIQVGIRNTALLLLPGELLLLWLVYRRRQPAATPHISRITHHVSRLAPYLLLFLLPIAGYLYIPLRAEWLIAQYGREAAIAGGWLADFYQSGLMGLIRYFTAADFTGGVVTNWSRVPAELLRRLSPLFER